MRYGLLLQLPLSKVLADINSVLLPMKEPSMFATLAALRFDDSKQLEYLSAGHCPLLHYRRRSGDVVRHSMSQFPLGLFVSTRYASLRIPYEGGDIFVLVTDGLLETGEDQDADCGLERLSETVRRLSDQPVAEIVEAIYGHARQDGPQQDDQTILLVRINEDLESQNRDAQPDQCPKLQDASRALEAKWQNLLGDLATELARD
jgi:sigma-B regulation protein RsbU (phosphoserine phosphatase)